MGRPASVRRRLTSRERRGRPDQRPSYGCDIRIERRHFASHNDDETLRTYVQLYLREEIKVEALVRNLPGFAPCPPQARALSGSRSFACRERICFPIPAP